jgi:hypothetical protein
MLINALGQCFEVSVFRFDFAVAARVVSLEIETNDNSADVEVRRRRSLQPLGPVGSIICRKFLVRCVNDTFSLLLRRERLVLQINERIESLDDDPQTQLLVDTARVC